MIYNSFKGILYEKLTSTFAKLLSRLVDEFQQGEIDLIKVY